MKVTSEMVVRALEAYQGAESEGDQIWQMRVALEAALRDEPTAIPQLPIDPAAEEYVDELIGRYSYANRRIDALAGTVLVWQQRAEAAEAKLEKVTAWFDTAPSELLNHPAVQRLWAILDGWYRPGA